MKKIRVAINGFGRIGRAFLKAARKNGEIEIVAINDLGELENLAYLLKYDTVYGRADFSIEPKGGSALVIDGHEITFLSGKDPAMLPWKDLGVDIVVEATGVFAGYEKAKPHLTAGAKRVVITAPVKDTPEDAHITGGTVLMGVNEEKLSTCTISANGSCTTNAGSPVLSVLHEGFGVEKAMLSTVHGYTSSQSIVDSPNKKDFRRGRAGAQNIVPSSTGAATAVTKALPALAGKFDGIALRVPVPVGSIADITAVLGRETTKDEVNEVFEKAAKDARWKGILSVTDEPIVSSDIIGDPHASIIDLSFTRVVGGNLVKVLAWYDNEMGYAETLVRHVIKTGQYI